jgi:hypothetical protein
MLREGEKPLSFAQKANGKSGKRAKKNTQNWIQYSIPQKTGQQIRIVGKWIEITGSVPANLALFREYDVFPVAIRRERNRNLKC